MFQHLMHGPLALTIFWIWSGMVLVLAACYWFLRPWLRRTKKPPTSVVKYTDRLRQRLHHRPKDGAPARRRGRDKPS